MLTFMKGLNMMDKKESCEHCDCCDCCRCKKMFMLLVVLLLTFMAGIMVGNCRHPYMIPEPNTTQLQRTYHRGMHEIAPKKHTATVSKNKDAAVGGFIVEIDQAQ